MHIEHIEAGSDDGKVTIVIEGLERDLKLLHITDSHMAEADERDPDAAEHVERFGELFQQRTPGGVPAREIFHSTVARGGPLGVDGAALTGDIIHFPALAGIDIIQREMQGLGVPFIYTLGNHDWHFPHLEWSDSTREQHYPRFEGLTDGNPRFQALEIGGVRLITLDNSNYQVSAEQVSFLRLELSRGQPCLLFIHIPLWIDSLTPAVMERWQAPIVMAAESGWTDETREKWRVPGNEDSTLECSELLKSESSQNLAGIFCGHVHFPHSDAYREDRRQYVTTPGFEGGYRVIELKRP